MRCDNCGTKLKRQDAISFGYIDEDGMYGETNSCPNCWGDTLTEENVAPAYVG